MAKNSFILYYNHQEIFDELTDEEAGKLIKAIFEYEITGEVSKDKLIKMAMLPIKQVLDDNKEKYEQIVVRNKENGKKGGRPKTEKTQNNPVVFLETQNNPKNLDIVIDTVIDYKDSINIKNSLKSKDRINNSCSYNSAHARVDNDNDNIFSYFENNFGHTIAPIEYDELKYWQKEFDDEIIKYAIDQSVLNNVKTMNYLKKILANYKKQGFKNLEMIKANEKTHMKKANEKQVAPEPSWLYDESLNEKDEIDEDTKRLYKQITGKDYTP